MEFNQKTNYCCVRLEVGRRDGQQLDRQPARVHIWCNLSLQEGRRGADPAGDGSRLQQTVTPRGGGVGGWKDVEGRRGKPGEGRGRSGNNAERKRLEMRRRRRSWSKPLNMAPQEHANLHTQQVSGVKHKHHDISD